MFDKKKKLSREIGKKEKKSFLSCKLYDVFKSRNLILDRTELENPLEIIINLRYVHFLKTIKIFVTIFPTFKFCDKHFLMSDIFRYGYRRDD